MVKKYFSILTVITIEIASKTKANTSDENCKAKQTRPSKIGDRYGTRRCVLLDVFRWSQNLYFENKNSLLYT